MHIYKYKKNLNYNKYYNKKKIVFEINKKKTKNKQTDIYKL